MYSKYVLPRFSIVSAMKIYLHVDHAQKPKEIPEREGKIHLLGCDPTF